MTTEIETQNNTTQIKASELKANHQILNSNGSIYYVSSIWVEKSPHHYNLRDLKDNEIIVSFKCLGDVEGIAPVIFGNNDLVTVLNKTVLEMIEECIEAIVFFSQNPITQSKEITIEDFYFEDTFLGNVHVDIASALFSFCIFFSQVVDAKSKFNINNFDVENLEFISLDFKGNEMTLHLSLENKNVLDFLHKYHHLADKLRLRRKAVV